MPAGVIGSEAADADELAIRTVARIIAFMMIFFIPLVYHAELLG
jgi:hypothetical protein